MHLFKRKIRTPQEEVRISQSLYSLKDYFNVTRMVVV
jgi:hypothetical protein